MPLRFHPCFSLTAVFLITLLFSSPARANDWSMGFKTSIPDSDADRGVISIKLIAGMGAFATDGYDGVIDGMALLAGPLQASFSHEGDPAYPAQFQDIWTDIRSDNFPQSWTIRIRSMQSAYPVTFEWSPSPVLESDFCRIQSLELMDDSTGLPVDLSGDPFLSYPSSGSLSSPDVRDFILTVNSTPQNSPSPPTGLRAKLKGQKIKLSWDRVNDFSVTGVRVWRRAEGVAEGVLLSEGPITERDFRDEDLIPGMTYIYSLSAVGKNGCESLRSEEISVSPKSFN